MRTARAALFALVLLARVQRRRRRDLDGLHVLDDDVGADDDIGAADDDDGPCDRSVERAGTVIDDTQEVGGTALYAVDLATGAAEALGQVGTEIGVLGLAVDADGGLIGLTDAPGGHHVQRRGPGDGDRGGPGDRHGGVHIAGAGPHRRRTLLALGDAGALMALDPITGVATATDDASVPFADPGIGLGVEPSTGQVIVTDAAGGHRRIDTSNGTVTDLPPLAYVEGDPNAGSTPRVVAVAVASDGTSFAIDATTASLAVLGHDGGLITIGRLGVDITDGASFDITVDGQGYLTSPG